MIGRVLAICGWLAMRASLAVRRTPLARLGSAVPTALGAGLLVLAVVPLVLPLFDAQPQDVTVQQMADRAVTEPSGWVRLRGTVTPLPAAPVGEPGSYAILLDATNPLRAVVLRSTDPVEASGTTSVSGHVRGAIVVIETEDLPIAATVAGTPPEVIIDRAIDLDPIAKPARGSLWPISIIPALLGAMFLVGARVGYPIFRPSFEVDVLTAALAPGERLDAAWAGRVGGHTRELADPGAALMVVRPSPHGNELTVQAIPDEVTRGASNPVPIGVGTSRGQLGYVYTVNETVSALAVRSEDVDATFLFARTVERDRVAAMVAVER